MQTTYRIRLSPEIIADVTGDYYPGFAGTREDPPEPESVTLNDVVINGRGVINSLTDEQLQRIERAWLRAFHDQYSAYQDESFYQKREFFAVTGNSWKR
jgi:hypothetical protein